MSGWNYLEPFKSISEAFKQMRAKELSEKESCMSRIGFHAPSVEVASQENQEESELT